MVFEDQSALWWSYAEIRQTQGAYAGEQVRLERSAQPGEALVVADHAVLGAIRQTAPDAARHLHDPSRRRLRGPLVILAAVALLGFLAAAYLWGIPALARVAASRVPVSWEERLGEAIVAELAPPARRCAALPHARAIEELTAAVTRPLGRSPYRFRVLVVDGDTVNAFALPGGFIVLFRGLLAATPRAETLAGVLAHGVQHVVHRHATRALLEHASTGLLIGALSGDVSGILAYGLESARTLGVLRYSRQHEEEADAAGLRLLVAAEIDPRGMIEFLEQLRQEHGDGPGALRYLSTHPVPSARIERLRRLAAAAPRPRGRLLEGYDWREIGRICPSAPDA